MNEKSTTRGLNGTMCPVAQKNDLNWKTTGWKHWEPNIHMVSVLKLGVKDTNKPFGLQFSSISRGAAGTAQHRTTSIPTANTADGIFEQF